LRPVLAAEFRRRLRCHRSASPVGFYPKNGEAGALNPRRSHRSRRAARSSPAAGRPTGSRAPAFKLSHGLAEHARATKRPRAHVEPTPLFVYGDRPRGHAQLPAPVVGFFRRRDGGRLMPRRPRGFARRIATTLLTAFVFFGHSIGYPSWARPTSPNSAEPASRCFPARACRPRRCCRSPQIAGCERLAARPARQEPAVSVAAVRDSKQAVQPARRRLLAFS